MEVGGHVPGVLRASLGHAALCPPPLPAACGVGGTCSRLTPPDSGLHHVRYAPLTCVQTPPPVTARPSPDCGDPAPSPDLPVLTAGRSQTRPLGKPLQCACLGCTGTGTSLAQHLSVLPRRSSSWKSDFHVKEQKKKEKEEEGETRRRLGRGLSAGESASPSPSRWRPRGGPLGTAALAPRRQPSAAHLGEAPRRFLWAEDSASRSQPSARRGRGGGGSESLWQLLRSHPRDLMSLV